jgi:hypothetical protein
MSLPLMIYPDPWLPFEGEREHTAMGHWKINITPNSNVDEPQLRWHPVKPWVKPILSKLGPKAR